MKKILFFFLLAMSFPSFLLSQNGTCIPPVGYDCVNVPRFIDSVWTTAAVTDFTNDASDCNAQDQDYQDYQNKIVSENANGSFVLHIGLNPIVNSYVGVWIDWNDDLSFGSGEQIFLSSATITHTVVVVNVPAGPDTVIMRVRCANISMGPCDSVTSGETEDYRVVVVDPSGMNEHTVSGWTFYQDANGMLNVNATDLSGSAEVSVIDVTGQLLLKGKMNAGNFSADVSQLPHGIYFIQCNSINGISSKKFLH